MQHSTYTEAGHHHANEDSLAVQPHPTDFGTLLCVLADGQGGQAGGAVASQIAVSKCLELAAAYSAKQLRASSSWEKILSGADQAVRDHLDAGFTTLIALGIVGNKISGASCGDSAAMLVNSSSFELLTEGQRKNPPIGTGGASPTAFSTELNGDSTLLVMSDGVWKFVGYDAIASLSRLKQGHDLIMALRQQQLNLNGGALPDDFSIIVV
jgi:serine/threonine protein phosphatase PrpC